MDVARPDSEFYNAAKDRLFGRQRPLHVVFGSGRLADVILWRNKRISGGIFAAATLLWLFIEWIGYLFLSFVCYCLIGSLVTSFLWSNVAFILQVPQPKVPKLKLQEDQVARIALGLRVELNQGTRIIREISSGKNLKKFLMVTLTLYLASEVGGWFDLLTLFYFAFVISMAFPALYEMHEDIVDNVSITVMVIIRKLYVALERKVHKKFPALQKKN